MKRKIALITSISFFTLVLTVAAYSYHSKGNGGKGHHHKAYHYNVKTVETVSGTVSGVEIMSLGYPHANKTSMYLTLESDNGTFEVHLGPEEFVKERIKIKKGDAVTVEGSRMSAKREIIFAKSVTRGDEMVKLRSDEGVPLWKRSHKQTEYRKDILNQVDV